MLVAAHAVAADHLDRAVSGGGVQAVVVGHYLAALRVGKHLADGRAEADRQTDPHNTRPSPAERQQSAHWGVTRGEEGQAVPTEADNDTKDEIITTIRNSQHLGHH